MNVCISKGTSKMGPVANYSLPAWKTCPKGFACWKICYAKRYCNVRATAREAYERNLEILENNPDQFWDEIDEAIRMNRFFRPHVSGDCPTYDYAAKVVEEAHKNPHCIIQLFTKRYEFFNEYIKTHGGEFRKAIPNNLKLLYSVDREVECVNPYNVPEVHIMYKDGFCTTGENAIECNGHCIDCFLAETGCIGMKEGDKLVIKQH